MRGKDEAWRIVGWRGRRVGGGLVIDDDVMRLFWFLDIYDTQFIASELEK